MNKFHLHAKEWFDRVNSNSYFSARVTDSAGILLLIIPFQYGYGEQYTHEARQQLRALGLLTDTQHWASECFTHTIKEKALKRDAIAWGQS